MIDRDERVERWLQRAESLSDDEMYQEVEQWGIPEFYLLLIRKLLEIGDIIDRVPVGLNLLNSISLEDGEAETDSLEDDDAVTDPSIVINGLALLSNEDLERFKAALDLYVDDIAIDNTFINREEQRQFCEEQVRKAWVVFTFSEGNLTERFQKLVTLLTEDFTSMFLYLADVVENSENINIEDLDNDKFVAYFEKHFSKEENFKAHLTLALMEETYSTALTFAARLSTALRDQ
jgi:hypothetical protein